MSPPVRPPDDAPPPAPDAPAAPPGAPAPAAPPDASAPPPSPSGSRESADVVALRDEVHQLRARVEAAEQRAGAKKKDAEPAPKPLGYESFWPWALPPEGISFGGYLQSQYESHEDSQDQQAQGGALLNKDRFSIRRARVHVIGEWEYAAFALEVDANTTNGPQVDLRKAEASLQYRPDREKPPMLMATLGQFDTPFGYELVESPRTRWFMERSAISRGFWPGEPDLGVRIAGALGFFRWTVAALNGEPLGENSTFALQDPNAAKDVVFRFGVDDAPTPVLHVAGGVSALRGTGFHPGTDATKASVQWVDANGDGVLQPTELVANVGRAATAAQNFDRWAVNADLRVSLRSSIGVTKVYGELTLGSNMDRGQFIADPITSGRDIHELGFVAGVVQEISPYGVAAFRIDYYDPNSDVLDKRQGKLLPFSEAITTYSPLVGVQIPDRARLVFQYDANTNSLARTVAGVPTTLKNNLWTVRLQVQL